ncbi:T9SS type A sorting domain-containing protein [candidate division KSB1 bacterium]|nr:T9SS type A sorting domain-containing protein [candidate division KSB1 bacterium]
MKPYPLTGIVVLSILCVLPCWSQRLQSGDLEYIGAFRLPDSPGMPDNVNWSWNAWSSALTFYPDGDAEGPEDGYPGSLFGVGHDHTQYVSEISIPVPVISTAKSLEALNTAETLQEFRNIRGSLFGEMEMPRVGLEYVPAQGEQTADKLYFAWAPHLDEGATHPSHGWCGLDLSDPQTAGAWRIGEYWNYVTGDYLFTIPEAWGNAHTTGKRLATGRFRDGGQGSMGPSVFAIGPWNAGNPPAPGVTLSAVQLLLYGTAYEENPAMMDAYHHSDEWSGAAWMTAGEYAAVVFIGTKGLGECWYGCADGTDEPPWPYDCDRGWWSSEFSGQMIFFDPADLAAVAQGGMEPWEPQPYAALDLDDVLFHVESSQQKYHLGAAGYDHDHGLLYVFEPLTDDDKSIIHVWKVNSPATGVRTGNASQGIPGLNNYPNPFNPETTIQFSLIKQQGVVLNIYNSTGQKVETLVDHVMHPGAHQVRWDATGHGAGLYFVELIAGDQRLIRKIHFIK